MIQVESGKSEWVLKSLLFRLVTHQWWGSRKVQNSKLSFGLPVDSSYSAPIHGFSQTAFPCVGLQTSDSDSELRACTAFIRANWNHPRWKRSADSAYCNYINNYYLTLWIHEVHLFLSARDALDEQNKQKIFAGLTNDDDVLMNKFEVKNDFFFE